MLKKLNRDELKEILVSRDDRKYLCVLNELKNVDNPGLAVTDMFGLTLNDGLVIVTKYCFNGYAIYFELSDFGDLKYFADEIKESVKGAAELLYSSDSEDIFKSHEFIELFGVHEVTLKEQYGLFALEKKFAADENVRLLTVDDESMILAFSEPVEKYLENLREAYETQIKTGDEFSKVYGYIKDGSILGYIIVNTFDNQYWDISYVYVSENARGMGIAKKLVGSYAHDMMSRDCFISYGTPINDISKSVAISSGFEMFERIYLTEWKAIR